MLICFSVWEVTSPVLLDAKGKDPQVLKSAIEDCPEAAKVTGKACHAITTDNGRMSLRQACEWAPRARRWRSRLAGGLRSSTGTLSVGGQPASKRPIAAPCRCRENSPHHTSHGHFKGGGRGTKTLTLWEKREKISELGLRAEEQWPWEIVDLMVKDNLNLSVAVSLHVPHPPPRKRLFKSLGS